VDVNNRRLVERKTYKDENEIRLIGAALLLFIEAIIHSQYTLR